MYCSHCAHLFIEQLPERLNRRLHMREILRRSRAFVWEFGPRRFRSEDPDPALPLLQRRIDCQPQRSLHVALSAPIVRQLSRDFVVIVLTLFQDVFLGYIRVLSVMRYTISLTEYMGLSNGALTKSNRIYLHTSSTR